MKRLWANILIALLATTNAIISNVIIYETTSDSKFSWHNIFKNPLLWINISIALVYNVIYSIYDKKKQRDEKFAAIIRKNLEKIYNWRSDKAIETNDKKEIIKLQRELQKEIQRGWI